MTGVPGRLPREERRAYARAAAARTHHERPARLRASGISHVDSGRSRSARGMISPVSTQPCCEQLRAQVEYTCPHHPPDADCPDQLLALLTKFQEYGLVIHDGGGSRLAIHFCPWCGTKLPASQRDRWFEELARRGVSEPENAPLDMRTDAWLMEEPSAG